MVKNHDRLARAGSAAGGVALTAGLGAALAALSTNVLETYGLALFVALPFCLGLLSALLYNARQARTLRASIGTGFLAAALASLVPIALALDGAICVVMALPLALPLAALGGWVGWLLQRQRHGDVPALQSIGAVALLLPLLMGAEAGADRRPGVHPVTTSVVIDAPPEVVWRHVVSFPPLPRPHELAFRAGVAYPTSATMTGRGPGAVRRCRFTTGDFVEPITVWDRPRLLRFTVRSQPAPMRELSPWRTVHAPHLDGFLVSHRGQFRLHRLAGGRTRLEGTTWYENRMWPARYWRAWSDGIIHTIHRRVLEHVKRLSETRPG